MVRLAVVSDSHQSQFWTERFLALANKQKYDAVFFSQTAAGLGVRAGQEADIVFMPQINEFRSRRSVQLVITDLRPHRA